MFLLRPEKRLFSQLRPLASLQQGCLRHRETTLGIGHLDLSRSRRVGPAGTGMFVIVAAGWDRDGVIVERNVGCLMNICH